MATLAFWLGFYGVVGEVTVFAGFAVGLGFGYYPFFDYAGN